MREHGSKVVFGKVARRGKPAKKVRPPTEVGQATLSSNTTCNNGTVATTPTYTADWDLPAYEVGDRAITVITHTGGGPDTADLTVPAGWTEIDELRFHDGNSMMHVLTRVFDGTEPSTTSFELVGLQSGNQFSQVTWMLQSNGVDLSVNVPEADIASGSASDIDPPPVTPSTGDARYWSFVVAFSIDGGDTPITAYPSGYTELLDAPCQWPNDNTTYVGYQLIDVTTTENPGVFSPTMIAGDHWQAATILVKESQGDPPVAGGDHTHTESDITDTATGVATILNTNTTIAVNHGLSTTPTTVLVTPRADPGDEWWVDTIGATQFTINVGTAVGADTDFGWLAFP